MKKRTISAVLLVALLLSCIGFAGGKLMASAAQSRFVLKDEVTMSEKEAELRQTVVDRMNAMATYIWEPKSTMRYTCYGNDGCANFYVSGEKAMGIPYNHNGGSLNRLKYCLDENGVVQDWVPTIGNDLYDVYIGADCSTALYKAWAAVCTSLGDNFPRTRFQCPWAGEGSLPVGGYGWKSNSTATTHYPKDEITGMGYTAQDLYGFYAQMKMGDGVITMNSSGGHTRMATTNPVVYWDPDTGEIDGEQSYMLFTQCGGVSRHYEYVTDENGNEEAYVCYWGINGKYTFKQLFNSSYLPFTCNELNDPDTYYEEAWVEIEEDLEAPSKYALCVGNVKSNYAIDFVTIRVESEHGEAWEAVQFPALDGNASYGYTDPMRAPYKELDLAYFEVALRQLHLRAGMTYHCSVLVTLMNDEEISVKEFDITMPAV